MCVDYCDVSTNRMSSCSGCCGCRHKGLRKISSPPETKGNQAQIMNLYVGIIYESHSVTTHLSIERLSDSRETCDYEAVRDEVLLFQ